MVLGGIGIMVGLNMHTDICALLIRHKYHNTDNQIY